MGLQARLGAVKQGTMGLWKKGYETWKPWDYEAVGLWEFSSVGLWGSGTSGLRGYRAREVLMLAFHQSQEDGRNTASSRTLCEVVSETHGMRL